MQGPEGAVKRLAGRRRVGAGVRGCCPLSDAGVQRWAPAGGQQPQTDAASPCCHPPANNFQTETRCPLGKDKASSFAARVETLPYENENVAKWLPSSHNQVIPMESLWGTQVVPRKNNLQLETLPKAQRIQGLSAFYKVTAFKSYHKLITIKCQNLDQTSTWKSRKTIFSKSPQLFMKVYQQDQNHNGKLGCIRIRTSNSCSS